MKWGRLHLFVVKYIKIFATGAEIRRYNGDKQIFFDIIITFYYYIAANDIFVNQLILMI